MATYTITTPVNGDTLATKVGSDTYNINGGYLTIDQDTRYGVNQNTSAGMGNIVLSATLGGTIEFNSTKVRIIPYNTGTGNVPALGTTITKSGASGILLGVYSALNVAPTAAAAAMPASGFIKIRQWNSVAYSAGALTGIGATATDVDRAGWLEIVGVDALTCTVNRLNQFLVRGDWFSLGTTDGNRTTTYQIPSNGAIVYLPGVWVETAISSNLYEFYPCAGSLTALVANVATDAVRGRWCWISTAGVVRFGHDGTNLTGGHVPTTGRRVRIPNIFFMCCTAAGLTVNVLPNATLATRYEFAATGGGVIDIEYACVNWYCNINQPYYVGLRHVGVLTAIVVTECATEMMWLDVGVGQEAANTQYGISMSLCFAGGTFTDCVFTRATLGSGLYITTMSDIQNFTFSNMRLHALGGARGSATTGSQVLTRLVSCTWTNCTLSGGRNFLSTGTDCTFTNTTYYDHPATTTPTTFPHSAFDIASNCLRTRIDGVTFGGLTLCQPYNAILNIAAAGCADTYLRNIGTASVPLDLGGARAAGKSWTRATTTATLTSVAHGLKVNDIIQVVVSSDIAAITIAAKTVASVATADTLTFTCLNAGAASGTLTYYPVMSNNLFIVAAGAAANNVYVQRCYTTGTRSSIYTADNSSKHVYIDNTTADLISATFASPQLVGTLRGVGQLHGNASQTSCYGTHWYDTHNALVPANISGQSWSRATTTATVTAVDHNFWTSDRIDVTVSSSEAAIILGVKTVTALTKDTFSFTCLNAGSASGTLTFRPLNSRIGLLMNESTSETVDNYSIDIGTAAFTSAGGLYMPTIGQQVTFTTPYYMLGHTEFPMAQVTMGTGTIANYDILYQLDPNDGTGYTGYNDGYSDGYTRYDVDGYWKNLNYTRTGGGGASSSANVTMTSTAGVCKGDYCYGTGVAPYAYVTSITNATTVVMSKVNTATVSGTLTFSQISYETAIDASLGFKMKWRFRTAITNATAISSLYLPTTSTTASRAYQYTLDPVTITVICKDASTGAVIVGARVYIVTDAGGPDPVDTVVINSLTDNTGTATISYSYTGNQPVIGRARKGTASTFYKTILISGTIDSTGFSTTVFMVADE